MKSVSSTLHHLMSQAIDSWDHLGHYFTWWFLCDDFFLGDWISLQVKKVIGALGLSRYGNFIESVIFQARKVDFMFSHYHERVGKLEFSLLKRLCDLL